MRTGAPREPRGGRPARCRPRRALLSSPVLPIATGARGADPSQSQPWRPFPNRQLTPSAHERCSGRPARPRCAEQDGPARWHSSPAVGSLSPTEPVPQGSPAVPVTPAARLTRRASSKYTCFTRCDHPVVSLSPSTPVTCSQHYAVPRSTSTKHTQAAGAFGRGGSGVTRLQDGRTRSPSPHERRALSPTRASPTASL